MAVLLVPEVEALRPGDGDMFVRFESPLAPGELGAEQTAKGTKAHPEYGVIVESATE